VLLWTFTNEGAGLDRGHVTLKKHIIVSFIVHWYNSVLQNYFLVHRLCLNYLSLCRVFAELRSYVDPPDTILHIVQAVLLILCPGQECETWAHCKQVELL